jgi:Zn-finger protein
MLDKNHFKKKTFYPSRKNVQKRISCYCPFLVPLITEGANLHSQEVEEKKMAEEVSNVYTRIF